MIRDLSRHTACFFVVLCLGLFPPAVTPALSAAITYPGALLGSPGPLGPNAPAEPNSLFPDSSASYNNVSVTGGAIGGSVFGGIAADAGDSVNNNKVTITDGRVGSTSAGGSVFGGWSRSGNAVENSVTIEGGEIYSIVFGGWIDANDGFSGRNMATGNTVTVKNEATLRDNIYGAYSQGSGGFLGENTVTIEGGAMMGGVDIIAGAYSALATNSVVGNTVTIGIGAGSFSANIYGGRGQSSSEVRGNTALVQGGGITGDIYGGQAVNDGALALVTGNTAAISGGVIKGDVYGGRAGRGTVSANAAAISGGSVTGDIYGGYSANNYAAGNTAAISGGNVTGDIYGGYSTNSYAAGNTVAISGGSVTGDIYGGYSANSYATGNTIAISGTPAINSVVSGGYAGRGGDAFSGNILNKDSAMAVIGTARNFEEVNFVYAGNANIATLDTTPAGKPKGSVTVTVDSDGNSSTNDTIIFTGDIAGTGNLVIAQGGTVQIGDGGAAGSLASTVGAVTVGENAALAFNRSDSVTASQTITGGGKVIQRGRGTLTLNNSAGAGNTFTGGTWIENGTLSFARGTSFNTAGYGADPSHANYKTNAGYAIFADRTAGNDERKIVLDTSSTVNMTHSFRTETGAEGDNTVDLIASPNAGIAGVNIADKGGAFYVAGGTEMTLKTRGLVLDNNRADGVFNDLYVEDGGTFFLEAGSSNESYIDFRSGIDSRGTDAALYITPLDAENGMVRLINAERAGRAFRMGTTTVAGKQGATIWLNLKRNDPDYDRVRFVNQGEFLINSATAGYIDAILTGDGIVDAAEIQVVDRAALILVNGDTLDSPDALPNTLTLKAPAVNFENFALVMQVNYGMESSQRALEDDREGIPCSNNDLLYIQGSGSTVTASGNSVVLLRTGNGATFTQGEYLLVHSETDLTALSNSLQLVSMDGFAPNSGAGPRGTYQLGLGGAPTGDGSRTGGTSSIWLTHSLNSLTLDWKGADASALAAPVSAGWENRPLFFSLQQNNGLGEKSFLSGDKVHISGAAAATTIDVRLLPDSIMSKTIVSGLVVGKNAAGDSIDGAGATYRIMDSDSVGGGITAEKTSAFGEYLKDSYADKQLIPTGMLQKYGGSTLEFANTGGNFFAEGVELYGGTVAVNDGNQLAVGNGRAIVFKDDATLQGNAVVRLDTPIVIEAAVNAAFHAAGGNVLTLGGSVSGAGSLFKTGEGELVLAGLNDYTGPTTVEQGALTLRRVDSAGVNPIVDVKTDGVLNLDIAPPQNGELNKTISGEGALEKEGSGTVTLTGRNTYTGGTTVREGVLAGNIPVDGDLTVNTGAVYDDIGEPRSVNALDGGGSVINSSGLTARHGDFNGVISGAGSLHKIGDGTLTLGGGNTYTGRTEVIGGTLALNGGVISDTLILYSGAAFDTGGSVNPPLALLEAYGGNSYWRGDMDMAGRALNFYLPAGMGDGGVMIHANGNAAIAGSTVNLGIAGNSSPLRVGDTVVLIDAASVTGFPANNTADGTGMRGVTLRYTFDLITTPSQLLATMTGARLNEQTKALPTGYISDLILLNQSGDLVAGQAMAQAMQVCGENNEECERGYGVFGVVSGGWSRYDTGSHVDMAGVSVVTGLARGVELDPGCLTLGAFFEYGNGSYDTHNSFSTGDSVNGRGDLHHFGGGVLARMDFRAAGPGHAYLETSVRVGQTTNENTTNLRDDRGVKAEYETSSAYYGAHLGSGYIWNFTDRDSLDLYGKYFWTRQSGDSAGLATGESVRYRDSESHRARVGARYARTVDERFSPYVGAAYEHEFNGKARAFTSGMAIEAPSLRGDTGIAELGLSVKPSATMPLRFDLGIQGYFGNREGAAGSLQVNWEF